MKYLHLCIVRFCIFTTYSTFGHSGNILDQRYILKKLYRYVIFPNESNNALLKNFQINIQLQNVEEQLFGSSLSENHSTDLKQGIIDTMT
jgi:hypothetical protein